MCELFGASAAHPRNLSRWLEPFRSHGGGSADNPDGWGVATWTGSALQIEKAPDPGARSARLAELARVLQAQILIAHVRKARMPPVPGLSNTHPFAHNGLVPDIMDIPAGPLCEPRGETDSEHAFCHLLAEIAGCYGDVEGDTWLRHLSRLAGSISQLGRFNFLLSDGASLIAYGHDRLHYLDRPKGSPDLSLVATEPLGPEPWRPFARGELRVYRAGALALRLVAPPATAETAMANPATA